MHSWKLFVRSTRIAAVALCGFFWLPSQAQMTQQESVSSGGPVRLQSAVQPSSKLPDAKRTARPLPGATRSEDAISRSEGSELRNGESALPREKPSEFERYVGQMAAEGRPSASPGEPAEALRRVGADMLWAAPVGDDREDASLVPDDYLIGPGDELLLDLWGGVEANLRLRVSRGGSITIPRVGTVSVAGVRFSEVSRLLRQRVGKSFRQFDLSVSMGELRSMRVHVTGYVVRPGTHVLPSLASLTQALAAAGGPTAIGSYRQMQLRRGGAVVENVDLYDMLLRGQWASDKRLQPGDVIHVPAVGTQVGLIGSVNQPGVFELRAEESIEDLIRLGGGLAPVANRDRAVIHAMGQADPVRELNLDRDARAKLRSGDVLRVHSLATLARPSLSKTRRVRVEGEVLRPGDYLLNAGATLRDALQAAGGLSPEAFVFGTALHREAVRLQQIESYDRTLRELETEFTRAAVTRKERVGPPSEQLNTNTIPHLRLIERLRQVQPTGRVVLELSPMATELPSVALEDGDRVVVPSRHEPVGVFGSVFNGASYQYEGQRSLGDYLKRAGGPTRGADEASLFVLRADGSVVSNRGGSGWFSRGDRVEKLAALPGDTVFVPEELDKIRLSAELKDWAQILSQFGLGAVALKNLTQ